MSKNRYLEIARQITDRVNSQFYKIGRPLPPRQELAEEFKVAKATIDRCIEHLTTSGLLTSRHGSGTYVNMREAVTYHIALISYENIRLPRQNGVRWHYFDYRELEEKSSRDKLLKYDGLIWFRPYDMQMNEWIPAFENKIHQILVNRTMPGMMCVSIDYREAYREITLERLRLYPGGRPFFLKLESCPPVTRYREAGFIDACREMGCFYDLVYLPDDFQGKFEVLEKYDWGNKHPLLLISDSITNTGAVMKWVWTKGLKWKKDLLYSDFDNDYFDTTWGIRVTTYLQDYNNVLAIAAKKILDMITGRKTEPEHLLIFPERRNGDT